MLDTCGKLGWMPAPITILPDLWFPARQPIRAVFGRRPNRVIPDLWFPRAGVLLSDPLLHQQKVRPVPIGVSIAAINVSTLIATQAGTSGLFILHGRDVYCLSANHILSLNGLIPPGSPVIQPGFGDGGVVDLDNFAHNSFYQPFNTLANEIDVALAHVDIPSDAVLSILENGIPTGRFRQAAVGMQVQKSGRTTGLTQSFVVAVNAETNTPEIPGLLPAIHHVGQVVVDNPGQAFAAGGDSGAGVYDLDGNLVGVVSHTVETNPDLVSCSPALSIALWLDSLFPPPPATGGTQRNDLPAVILSVSALLLFLGIIEASRDSHVR